MKISPDNLSKSLLKELLPCYLVSGDEPLLIQESLDLIRLAAEKEGFTSRDLYDQTQSLDWNEILNSCRSLSLFAEKKIIEIRLNSLRLGRIGSKSIIELIEEIAEVYIKNLKFDSNSNKPSLAGKWAPRIYKSLDNKTNLGKFICERMYPEYKDYNTSQKLYRLLLSRLNKNNNIPERIMCDNDWDLIQLKNIPSKCFKKIKKHF